MQCLLPYKCFTHGKHRDEHKRRSPECTFFILTEHQPKTSSRAKKARTSKASRASLRSNATTQAEEVDVAIDTNSEDSIVTTATDVTLDSTVSTTAPKKRAPAKKGKGRQTKASKAQGEAEAEAAGGPSPAMDVEEPEDDNFEVKVNTSVVELTKPNRGNKGRKRTSEQMGANVPSDMAPAPKRRATRTRESTAKPELEPEREVEQPAEVDTSVQDAQSEAGSAIAMPKRAAKGSKKRGSSTSRKASGRSTASKSVLRARTPDEEIEAALEADLERPPTDDDMRDVEPEVVEDKPKRRLTRTEPEAKRLAASKARLRANSKFATEPRVQERHISVEPPELENMEEARPLLAFPSVEYAVSESGNFEVHGTDDSIIISRDSGVHRQNDAASESGNFEVHDNSDTDQAVPDVETDSETCILRKAASKPTRGAKKSVPVDVMGKDGRNPEISRSVAEVERKEGVVPIPEEEPHKPEMEPEVQEPPSTMEPAEESSSFEEVPSTVEDDPKSTIPVEEIDGGQVEAARPKPATIVTKTSKAKPKAAPITAKGSGRPKKALTEAAVLVPPAAPTPPRAARYSPAAQLQEELENSIQPVHPEDLAPSPSSAPRRIAHYIPELSKSPPRRTTNAPGSFPSPTPSPQSSNAENEPPSSRPSQTRPPLADMTSSQLKATPGGLMRSATQIADMVAAAPAPATPSRPSARKHDRNAMIAVDDQDVQEEWNMKSSYPWRAVDMDAVFQASPSSKGRTWSDRTHGNKENLRAGVGASGVVKAKGKGKGLSAEAQQKMKTLTSPERRMTVEQWISFNAERGERRLKEECERVVGRFESEGVRALKALEGLEVIG